MQRGIAAENCGYAFFMCAWRRMFLMGASCVFCKLLSACQ